jgi:polyhydroxybutyrate depolymerase
MLMVLAACGTAGGAGAPTAGPPAAGDSGATLATQAPPPSPAPTSPSATGTTAAEPTPTARPIYAPDSVEPVTVPPAPTIVTVPLPSLIPTLPPATCGAADGTVTLAGRPVLLRAPALASRAPLVLVLHGYTGTPQSVETSSRFTDLATRVGAIVAYPQGTKVQPRGFGWASGANVFAVPDGDDVAVLSGILDELVAGHCVDPSRVLLVGESNGGGMVLRAVCDPRMNGRVTAVAPVIPAVGAATIAGCAADGLRPVPLLAVAGAADDVVPYLGTPDLLGQETWFGSVATDLNGCSTDVPLRTDPSLQVAIRTASGCAVNTALVTIGDGDHTWPGADVAAGGTQPAGGFLATEAIWALFAANVAAGN